jgi:hypothetical protein
VDVILGADWIAKNEAIPKMSELSLTVGRPPVTLGVEARRDDTELVKCLLSKTALRKQLAKQIVELYVVHVRDCDFNESPALSGQSDELPNDLRQLKEEFKDLFTDGLPPGPPPNRGAHTHKISTDPQAKPPISALRRYSPAEREEMQKQITALLEKGFIKPSASPYGAAVLFAKKKDGSLRMCVDYRALNDISTKDKYPLPRIDELLDRLHGAKYFSSIDLASGYWQIPIDQESQEKTAFRTPFGSYEFSVMPFGLSNAPATFQRLMNSILATEMHEFVLVYLDDILVFSKSPEEHAKHLRRVLLKLRELKPSATEASPL